MVEDGTLTSADLVVNVVVLSQQV